ncbi:TniQ family protein [Methylobacterium pseudosasicola]|uniref:TniQ protein n=1 Tax=Methylobacterium pseudosasicola TaxID=582667 RepID=A0A1I4P7B5_9HYPH|nr:TniQ family protein [Methylobacterium pseudosasicola]SFM23525.1 TniQ protein [Methylobacterium pseudosasicola]
MTDDPLLLTLPLMDGESTFDYLSRLAARNGVATMARFCKDQGLSPRRIRDGCPVELARLGKLSGVPVRDLEAASIRKVAGGFMLRGHHILVSSIRKHRFRVCPACLRTDIESSDLRPHVAAYGRLAWKVVSIRTCPQHGLGLADIGSGTDKNDQDFTCAVRLHAGNLGALAEQAPRRPASELERYLRRRIDGLPGNASFLDGLELHAAARFCEVVGAFALHGRKTSMNAFGDHDWYLCGAVGIGIACDGEDAIRRFLTGLQRAYPYGHHVKYSPLPPFLYFKSWLNSRNCTGYAPAKDLLARHVAETPPDVVQDKPRITLVRPEAPPAVPGMPRKILVTSARPRRIEPTASLVARKPTVMDTGHPAASRPPYDPARHAMLTSNAAAAWLGCDASLFVSLQAHGLLTPTYGDGCWRHAFERGQLDDLLTRLLAGAELIEDTSDGVGITEAARRCSCAPVEIVHLLLADEVSWKGRHATGKGIASLLVRTDAIHTRLEKQALSGPTLKEARLETGVDVKVLASLISMGAMDTGIAIDAMTRSPVNVIYQSSLEDFFGEYVELMDVGRAVRQSSTDVRRRLKAGGFESDFEAINLNMAYYKYDKIDECYIGKKSLQ